MQPPKIKKQPVELKHLGTLRMDEYAWLKDKTDLEVIEHLKKENEYVDKKTAHTQALQKTLYKEFQSRMKETDLDVPYRMGPYLYYSRTEKGKNYRIYCRKQNDSNAKETIILDSNELAQGKEYMELGDISVSHNHQYMAYTVDFNGSEKYDLCVKDLKTGEIIDEKVKEIGEEIVWASDDKNLFYKRLDETMRPDRVFRHKLGTPEEKDELKYHEKNQAYYLELKDSKSKKFIFITAESKITSEEWFLSSDDPKGSFQRIEPRKEGVEYESYHHGDHFLIVTNEGGAVNYKVMQAPISSPARANWKEFVPYDSDRRVEELEVFQDYVVILERFKGLQNARVVRMDNREIHEISFDEASYVMGSEINREFHADTFRLYYESPITSHSIFEYSLKDRTKKLLKRKEVLGGYDPSKYIVERLFAKGLDGTRIPITLLRKKEFSKNGSHPLLLTGYGAYEICNEPVFNSYAFSLVDRGFSVCTAHIRGGGEMGREWYEKGKFLFKKNTFEDFIACAEFLIQEKYTAPKKIAISGGSAGGLLMGAVINMRPDLWGAVLALVPFVDVVNTMLDPNLPLTVTEYDEWGDPNEKKYFEYMLSYSPYDNIEKKDYPPILATGGLNDPRVGFWEPAKWVAKLREYKIDSNEVLLKTEMGMGHAGPSGRYKRLEEQAFYYAFVLNQLNHKE